MSNILDRGMSEDEARDHLALLDRRSWYASHHAHNAFAIMSGRDGREVCRCAKKSDRDIILALIRKE